MEDEALGHDLSFSDEGRHVAERGAEITLALRQQAKAVQPPTPASQRRCYPGNCQGR